MARLQRLAVWTHQLESGALLLFAFFMISDPMTSPNSRRGRIAHAAVVVAIALSLQFGLYLQNSVIWALFCGLIRGARVGPHFSRAEI